MELELESAHFDVVGVTAEAWETLVETPPAAPSPPRKAEQGEEEDDPTGALQPSDDGEGPAEQGEEEEAATGALGHDEPDSPAPKLSTEGECKSSGPQPPGRVKPTARPTARPTWSRVRGGSALKGESVVRE